MSNYTRTLVYLSETAVNGVAVANTLLTRTRDSGSINFHTFQVFCKVITASGITTGCTFSVGTNSPNFDNIVPATVMVGPIRVFEITSLASPMGSLPVDTDINIRVSVAATGGAPVLTFRVAIVGVEV